MPCDPRAWPATISPKLSPSLAPASRHGSRECLFSLEKTSLEPLGSSRDERIRNAGRSAGRRIGSGRSFAGRERAVPRRRRRDGRAHARAQLAARRSARRRMAAQPEDRGAHHADLAPADLDRLGPRADLPLQRSLQVDHRRQASLGAGPADRRGLARDLARHRPDARHRHAGRRGHLRRRAAPDHGAQRLSRRDLLHLLLQPDPRRRRRRRRHHLRQYRRHAARHRRAPARLAARTRGGHGRCAHAGAGLRAQRAALATDPRDLPFALLYLARARRRAVLTLAGASGIARGHPAAPETLPLDDGVRPGRSRRCCATSARMLVRDSTTRFEGDFPTGAWDQPPTQAAVDPRSRRAARPAAPGVLVAGLNPFRLFDDDYRRFLDLVAGEIGAGIANAAGLRGGAPPRRGAGRDRSRQDRVLLQCQPRIPHAADADAGAARGRAQRSVDATLDPVQRERVDVVHRNALRLLRLVNTLLDFSRIEAGRIAGRVRADRSCRAHRRTRRRISAR